MSFDQYANWNAKYSFGKESVLYGIAVSYGITGISNPTTENEITEDEINNIHEVIEYTVIETARDNPDIQFDVFFPPYSAIWWGMVYQSGNLNKQIEAEKRIIEQLLEIPNIRVFSWNDKIEYTENLDLYKDTEHYSEYMNSCMLKWMSEEVGLLDKENYMDYLRSERELYSNYDYMRFFQ